MAFKNYNKLSQLVDELDEQYEQHEYINKLKDE